MKPEEYIQRVDEVAATPMATYTPSTAVQEADTQLSQLASGKPSSYQQQDADRLGSLFDQIMQRGQYQYDPTTDPTTRQYVGAYQQAGKQAAKDTMQYANQLGGGYGNTYSGAVGAQQYSEYLKGMYDQLPNLQANAISAYNAETDRLSSLYEIASNRDDTAYNRYRDQVNDWKTDRAYAQQYANNVYSRDYQNWSDRMNMASTAAGWNREDFTRDRSDAYEWAIKLIGQGILPNADILETAGITEADAIELAKKYGYDDGTGGGGGKKKKKKSGGSKSSTSTSTASTSGQGFLTWVYSTITGGKNGKQKG